MSNIQIFVFSYLVFCTVVVGSMLYIAFTNESFTYAVGELRDTYNDLCISFGNTIANVWILLVLSLVVVAFPYFMMKVFMETRQ